MSNEVYVTDECFRLRTKSSVHYFWKEKIADIRMSYIMVDETPFSEKAVPSVDIYEWRKFLWVFPYKKYLTSFYPTNETQEQVESLKNLYIMLYDWWKFNKWDKRDEN